MVNLIEYVNEIIRNKPRRTLVLVPTTILLDQWINDGFKAAGVEASAVGGGEKQWGEYTVSTYQSAIRNLEKIPSYDIVIFDEVHHLFSPEYSKILYSCENHIHACGASLRCGVDYIMEQWCNLLINCKYCR